MSISVSDWRDTVARCRYSSIGLEDCVSPALRDSDYCAQHIIVGISNRSMCGSSGPAIAEAPDAMYDPVQDEEFLRPVDAAEQLKEDVVEIKCHHCEAGEAHRVCLRGYPPPTADAISRDNMDLSRGGVKYDQGKPRMDLLAPEFIEGVSSVLAYGARKYADRNWEKGMRWGRCVGAFLRHIFKWMSGEDVDPESKLHHLDHAACCLMFLRAYVARQIGEDDRKRVFD